MVVEVQELDQYETFIRELSSEPCFYDPHFCYDADNLYGAPQRKDESVYAVVDEGTVRGLFVWLILPEDRYVEMLIGFTREERAFCEMLEFLGERYAGWDTDLVVNPRNEALRRPLEARGGRFEPEQQRMRWSGVIPEAPAVRVEIYTERWRGPYLALHRTDTYWTAERVLAAQERFRVLLAVRGREVLGYLDVTAGCAENEIYDLFVKPGADDRTYALALLGKAVQLNGPAAMQVMVDVDAAEEIDIYRAAGFEKVEGQNHQTVTCRL